MCISFCLSALCIQHDLAKLIPFTLLITCKLLEYIACVEAETTLLLLLLLDHVLQQLLLPADYHLFIHF